MIRIIKNTVVTLCLSLLLVMGSSSCAVAPSLATPMLIDPVPRSEAVKPESPGELLFMQTPSVLGLSKARVEEKLGPGVYRTLEEDRCTVPLIEENVEGQAEVTSIIGRVLVYHAENPEVGWKITRFVCIVNDTAVRELFDAAWLEGTQWRHFTHSVFDVELIREVFWDEYKGDYQMRKLLEKPSKGPKYEI